MPRRYLVGLFVLGAIWGAAFLFIKISVAEIPPSTLVAVRLAVSALVLVAVLYAQGMRLPAGRRIWLDFAFVGSVGLVVPFLLITWGQQFIDTGMTAILNAAVPLFSALLAYFWTGEERLGGLKLLGLALGFAGVVAAVGPDGLSLASSGTQGELAVLGATLCYAVTGLYGRRAFRGMKPLVPAAGQLLAGALIMLPIAPLLGGLPRAMPSAGAIAALAALSLLCTCVAYIMLYWMMDHIGATRTSMVTYLIAPFGLLYGAVFLQERIGPGAIGGLALVIVGILLTNGVVRAPSRKAGDVGAERA